LFECAARARRESSVRSLLLLLVLLWIPGVAWADLSPIQTSNEPSLDQPGGILDQLYGLANLVLIDDFNASPDDQLWVILSSGSATATAKFAGLSEDFGFLAGEGSGATFQSLFVVGGSGFLGGPTALLDVAQTGNTFRFALAPSSGDLWSSRMADNSDASDHMVAWRIVSSDAAHPANPIGSYAIGWEDLPILAPPAPGDSEPDYNDLVIELSNVAPAVCGDNVVSGSEECDDGNTSAGDCCSATCSFEAAGSLCDDGNACTIGDVCDGSGSCGGGTPLQCDDGNACTADSCDAVLGCLHAPLADGTACLDGNLCNGSETCQAGVCTAGTPLVCDDGQLCNGAEACDPLLGCVPGTPVADGTSCADGTVCNGAETCVAGVCTPGAPLNCDDGNLCTADSCDPVLGCQSAPVADGTSCADGTVCNGAETCVAGTCTAGTPLVCDDGNVCTADSCDPVLGCQSAPVADGTSCADGTVCNGAETCVAGTCTAGTPLVCDDGNPCTADSCDALLGCQSTAVADGTSCADGTVCNGAETCVAGACTAGTPLNCDDGNVCTADSCDALLGCQNVAVADGTSCADGTVCNGAETCVAGACTAGTPLVCDDGNACTADSCDALLGCQNVPVADGTACQDGNLCNGSETCVAGTCTEGTPLADGLSCSDGNLCNGAETCLAGSCLAGTPLADGAPCLDGDVCNGSEMCQGGICLAGTPLACDDGNMCTADSCDLLLGCKNDPIPDCGNPMQAVVPLLDCVDDNGDGTFTAHFGYRNDNAVPITIPVGPNNFFAPAPMDVGQPGLFGIGRHPFFPNSAVAVTFDGTPLSWTLQGPDGIARTSTASTSSSRCPPPASNLSPHAMCYKVSNSKGTPKAPKLKGVRVQDVFEDKLFDLAKTKSICAPAETIIASDLSEILDPEDWMMRRKLRRSRGEPKFDRHDPAHQNLVLNDQFGNHQIDVLKPRRLLFPTALCNPEIESCPATPAGLDTSGLGSARYKCYRVRFSKGATNTSTFNMIGSDEFQNKVYSVKGPKSYCVPASVNGSDPTAAASQDGLLCYLVIFAAQYCEPGSPQGLALQKCGRDDQCGGGQCVTVPKPILHRRRDGLMLNNDFAPETVRTWRSWQVCIPARRQ